MKIEMGNAHALTSEGGVFVPMEGEFVTSITLDDDTPISVVLLDVLDLLPYHFENGYGPSWIRSDNPTVQKLLGDHFGVTNKARPKSWGSKNEDVNA